MAIPTQPLSSQPSPTGMRGGVNIPQPSTQSTSKRPMYILLGIVLAVLVAFAYALQNSGKSGEDDTKKDSDIDKTSIKLHDGATRAGIITQPKPESDIQLGDMPTEQPEVQQEKSEQTAENTEPEKTPEEIRAEELRAAKLQQYLNAVTAPMKTGASGSGGNRQETTDTSALPPRPQQPAGPQYTMPAIPGSSGYDPAADKDKEEFFERARTRNGDSWLLETTRIPGWEYEIKTGTVIPAVMITGINSELPGVITAQTTQNIYNTSNGKHLLIPQGCKLYGVYDSRVSYGQSRILIAWNRLIFPDGSSVSLGAMPGADASGYAGFKDKVDNHYFRIFGSAFLMSAIIGANAYAVDKFDNDDSDDVTFQDEMGTSLAQEWGEVAKEMVRKNMNLAPTLEIRPGFQFQLVVIKDIPFMEPYNPYK